MTTASTYQPWEYRALGKGYGTRETAALLGRSEEDVERKLRSYQDTTLDRWYRRHKTVDGPETVCRIRAFARKIVRENFPNVIEAGEFDHEVIHVLRKCFKSFDRTKLPEGKFVEDAFVEYFRFCFRRRLTDLNAGRFARKNRRHANIDDVPPVLDYRAIPSDKADEMAAWSRRLLRLALPRLNKRMRQVVEFRYLEGMDTTDVSKRTGLLPSTIRRHYGFGKVVEAIKKVVNSMILSIPPKSLDRIVYYLHFEADFTTKDLAELLCIPKAMVDASLDRTMGKILKGLDRDKVMSLLGG